MGTPRLQIRPGNPDFLDLPWEDPINTWDHPRRVEMPSGVHRHPVIFVAYPEGVYAIKEMSARLSEREYQVLGILEGRTSQVATPAGLVERLWLDPHDEGAAAVITRYVEHSFPYRHLVSGPGFGVRRSQMMDALAGLLVELHTAGCYWGDCSLSNVLNRFDADGIEAVMIDGETSELHDTLSDGQRLQDIEIMKENVAGEMFDIAAMGQRPLSEADLALGEDIANRYLALWSELTDVLVLRRDESYKIRERISRLNDLGFSVSDVEIEPIETGGLLRMRTHVGGRSFHRDELRMLTGVEASENQARTILGDLNYYLAKEDMTSPTKKSVGTFKWLTYWFEPLLKRIEEQWHGEDPVQGYCDFLNHRLALASARRSDVGNDEAFDSWVENGFPGFHVDF
ncbi:MAG: DUF4032 domain-containing protein [Acidimicrobiia bacterium]